MVLQLVLSWGAATVPLLELTAAPAAQMLATSWSLHCSLWFQVHLHSKHSMQ